MIILDLRTDMKDTVTVVTGLDAWNVVRPQIEISLFLQSLGLLCCGLSLCILGVNHLLPYPFSYIVEITTNVTLVPMSAILFSLGTVSLIFNLFRFADYYN